MSYIGIELGGTKVVLAHGDGPDRLSPLIRLPTLSPEATLKAVITAIDALIEAHGPVRAIGVASFGPIGLDPNRSDYGRFLSTPKPGYSHADLLGPLRQAFPDTMFRLDTDVNGAAFAEQRWGAGQGLESLAYVTVGTGIGVGAILNHQPVHGLLHPEAGHILVRRDPGLDPFLGVCPFHGDCLEGLASGPAVAARVGRKGEEIADDDPVWALLGDYLAQLLYNLILSLSPLRIIVGGGVGLKPAVLDAAKKRLPHYLGGYIGALATQDAIGAFVVPASLDDRAGVLGAIALASRAAHKA
jgi:fructokinase